jgi:hypothetical protein
MRALPIALIACAIACGKSQPVHRLDQDLVRVSTDARLRTDTVGEGRFVDTATFVLVDADNTSKDGANITLGGELHDASGAAIDTLNNESLWIPAGETRTFALVDSTRKPRPDAVGARIEIKGAVIPEEPPVMHVEDLHSFDDSGKQVVAATIVNAAERPANAIVIASFHGADGRPMTRPFSLMPIGGNIKQNVRFVGPAGSTTSTIYVGAVAY